LVAAANVVVTVENVDDKNDSIEELIVPLPPPAVDCSSHDDKQDGDEPATTSLHELSISPDHHQLADQSSDITTSQELPSSDDVTDNTNLLTSI